MKQDENRTVLGSLPSYVGSRGHCSLGDDSNVLASLSGSIKHPGDQKNINSRGWNFSTRASPFWRHRSQGNKENPRVLVPRKFQHVQSKLSAPIYSQRRQAQRKEGTQPASGSTSAGLPPRSSSSVAHGACSLQEQHLPSHVLQDDAMSPELPTKFKATQFVTFRERRATGGSIATEQSSAEAANNFNVCQHELGVAGSPGSATVNEPPVETNSHQDTLEGDTKQLPSLQEQLDDRSLDGPIAGADSCSSPASIVSARATAPDVLASSSDSLPSAGILQPSCAISILKEPLIFSEDVTATTATPDLSVISREPEPVPFSAWKACLNGGLDGLSCGASPEAGLSRVGLSARKVRLQGGNPPNYPSPQLSPTRSAGLSVVTQPIQPVAFDAWARVQGPCHSPTISVSFESSATAYAQVGSPKIFAGQETVCKPSRYDESPGAPAMLSSRNATPTHAAQLRSNPLFESDSPASSISMALPERSDALSGFASSPSPARHTTIPSLASTPMTERSQGPPSRAQSPLGNKFYDSPCSALRRKNGEITSPCFEPTAVTSSLRSELEAPSFGDMAVEASRNSDPAGSDASLASYEPTYDVAIDRMGACTHDTLADAGNPDALRLDHATIDGIFSPVRMSEYAVSPGSLGAVNSPVFGASAGGLSSTLEEDVADVEEQVSKIGDLALNVTQPAPASAASSPSQRSHTSADAQECALVASCSSKADRNKNAGPHGSSYPATPSATWPESPSTVYATPLDDFPTPGSILSCANGINRTAKQHGHTPSARGHIPASNASTPVDFSFGLGQPRIVTFDGCPEAATPDLALGLPGLGPFRLSDAVADVLSPQLISPGLGSGTSGFGSPLPLMQLTPLQLRVLDDFAGKVIAAMSPVLFETRDNASAPSSVEHGQQSQGVGDESSQLAQDTEHFNFGDLLAKLRSPLPVPLARSSVNIARDPADKGRPQSLAQPIEEFQLLRDENSAQQSQPAAPGMPPSASPMPNFAQLMAFLSRRGRTAARVPASTEAPCACRPSSESPQESSALDAELSAAGGLVDQAATAAAAFSFVQLLAHLRSPLPKGGGAGPNIALQQVSNSTSLQAAVGVDSPVIATGMHDSPATSEAASFGFSTAAKQMSVRMTPSTTPGDCAVSFLRWTRDTAPPTFRLDSEAGPSICGRDARSPLTPMSFTFGGLMHGGQAAEEATPAVGRRQPVVTNGSSVSPDGVHQLRDINSPPQSDHFEDLPASAATPAFSFGRRRLVHSVTPSALPGAAVCHNGDMSIEPLICNAGDNASRNATPIASSPVPSLGFWGFGQSLGSDSAAFGSPSPSELGFAFNLSDAAILATPMLAGVASAAAAAAATLTADNHMDGVGNVVAALEHVVAMSPTLFGMAAVGSPEDTPGVTQRTPAMRMVMEESASAAADTGVPNVPAFWAALLGSLHSPMPSHIQGRTACSQQQALAAKKQHQSPTSGVPSPDTLPAPGGVSSIPEVVGKSPYSPDQAPPPYEALPDLIARGLCLPASTVLTTEPPSSSLLTYSSVGESATPFMHVLPGAGTALQMSTAIAELPVIDTGTTANESSPLPSDRLFQPSRRAFVSPSSAACYPCPAQPAAGDLLLESVSDSNLSAPDMLQTDMAPSRTTDPLPTPSRTAPTAISCMVITQVHGGSVHSSPVQSFHAPSDNSSSGEALPQSQASVHGKQSIDTGIALQQPSVCSTKAGDQQLPVDFVPKALTCTSVAEARLPSLRTAHSVDGVGPNYPADNHVVPASASLPSPPFRRSVGGEPQSPAYSYLGPWVPTVTPPTAELASRSSLSGQYDAANSPGMHGRQISSARSGEFWAPNSCVSLGASGERVTLEAPNRRISMNADLLLDFQGSPVVMPSPSVTPRLGPCLGATRLHPSPAHKSWDAGHLSASVAASASQTAAVIDALATKAGHLKPRAPAALPVDEGIPPAAPVNFRPTSANDQPFVSMGATRGTNSSSSMERRPRVQLPGPLIQQVAAGIDSTFASVAAVIQPKESWMPRPTLSQRLGLWQSSAWGAPSAWPMTASAGQAGAASAGQLSGPSALGVVERPLVTSRDVQTTPSLTKTVQTQAQGQDAGAVAKPVFRSRIPAPASLGQPQALEKSVTSVATSGSSIPPISEAEEVAGPTERVVRGRRLLPAAGTSGGAQRVPIKKAAQRVEIAGSEVPPAVGEEEMRRRAHVLGMRISPYLRPKAARVRITEAAKPNKG